MLISSPSDQIAAAVELFEDSHFLPVAMMRTLTRDEAQEVLGISYEKALERWGQYDPRRGGVRNWILAIISHTSIDRARWAKRHKTISLDAVEDAGGDVGEYWPGDDPTPEQIALAKAKLRAVRLAVAALPSSFRAAVRLVWMQGLRCVDAAKILGCPVGTVKTRLYRSRARLRRALGEYRNGGSSWNS